MWKNSTFLEASKQHFFGIYFRKYFCFNSDTLNDPDNKTFPNTWIFIEYFFMNIKKLGFRKILKKQLEERSKNSVC